MFYEEKLINGLMRCRSTPNGEWRLAARPQAAIINSLMALTDEQRIEVFRFFCTTCGCDDPQCQCWNDD